MKQLVFALAALVFTLQAHSVTIEFPEEELAKESVLPVFEGGTVAVKSRRVNTNKRIEVGAMAGFIFNEPFFSPLAYGIHAGYHLNEFHSVHLNAVMRTASLSGDAEQVDKDLTTAGVQKINFPAVPIPKYFFTLDYQLTPYYGKISLTKDYTMNLALYTYAGIGMIDLGGAMAPILDLGVGQNLFFTNRFALRIDMKFLMYQGPNVTSIPAVTSAANATVEVDRFEKQFNFSPSVMLGAIFLL